MKRLLRYAVIFVFCIASLFYSVSGFALLQINIPFSAVVYPGYLLDLDEKKTTDQITVIKREQFEGKTRSLADVLQDQAGTYVRSVGGLGSYAEVSVRGASARQVMIYMDGVPLTSASGNSVDLAQINLENVEQIEIYKGNAPIQFAQQYQGGVINIRTRRLNGKNATTLKAQTGSWGYQKLLFSHQQAVSRGWFYISLDTQSAKNDFSFLNDNATRYNPYDDYFDTRNNAQTARLNALLKGDFGWGDDYRFSSQLGFNQNVQHFPSLDNDRLEQSFFSTEDIDLLFRFLPANQQGSGWLWESKLAIKDKKEQWQPQRNGVKSEPSDFVTRSISLQQFQQKHFKGKAFLADLKLQAFIRNERYLTNVPQSALMTLQSKNNHYQRQQLNLAVETPFYDAQEKWRINARVQVKYLQDKNLYQQVGDKSLQSLDNNWHLGVAYQLFSGVTLNANIGEYVRQPSFSERYTNQGLVVGNPELQKESGLNQDVGISMVWKPEAAVKQVKFSLNAYQNKVEQVIVQTFNARGIGRYINLADALINGLESSLALNGHYGWFLELNYSYQTSQVRSALLSLNNTRLPNQPLHSFNARLEKKWQKWVFYYNADYSSGAYYDHTNLLLTKAIELHDAGIHYQYKVYRFAVEARNLLDRNYQVFNGYPSAGRSFFLTFSAKY